MKKLAIVLVIISFLIACEEEKVTMPKPVTKNEVVEKEVIDEDYYNYLDDEHLDEIIIKSNEVTNIIDIEFLHNKLIKVLDVELDANKSIAEQEKEIAKIVKKSLNSWKREVILETINTCDLEVNKDDFDYIMTKTSISDAYKVMFAYEMIFLDKYND